MANSFGPNLGLLVDALQGEAHYANLMKQWRGIDALIQCFVINMTTSTPPSTPADGDTYVVGASPTGAWAGKANQIARWSSVASAWEFYVPRNGWEVRDLATLSRYYFDGTSWNPVGVPSIFSFKSPCRVVATTNINIAAPGSTIDSTAMANGDRVLLAGQTTASQNGLYNWNGAAAAMTRTTDADTSSEVKAGMIVPVTEGTIYADTLWILTTNATITLGTTALAFSRFAMAPTFKQWDSSGNAVWQVDANGQMISQWFAPFSPNGGLNAGLTFQPGGGVGAAEAADIAWRTSPNAADAGYYSARIGLQNAAAGLSITSRSLALGALMYRAVFRGDDGIFESKALGLADYDGAWARTQRAKWSTGASGESTLTGYAANALKIPVHIFDTANALTTGYIASFRNAGVEKVYIDGSGIISSGTGLLLGGNSLDATLIDAQARAGVVGKFYRSGTLAANATANIVEIQRTQAMGAFDDSGAMLFIKKAETGAAATGPLILCTNDVGSIYFKVAFNGEVTMPNVIANGGRFGPYTPATIWSPVGSINYLTEIGSEMQGAGVAQFVVSDNTNWRRMRDGLIMSERGRRIGWLNAAVNTWESCACGASTVGTPTTTTHGTGSYNDYTTTATIGNAVGIDTTFAFAKRENMPIGWGEIFTGSDITNIRLWFGWMNGDPGGSATPALHLAAFRYDTGADGTAFWRCVTDNASGVPTVTTTTKAIAASTAYRLEIWMDESGMVKFYIDGTLVATHTTTLPTSTTGIEMRSRLTTLAAVAKTFGVSTIGRSAL